MRKFFICILFLVLISSMFACFPELPPLPPISKSCLLDVDCPAGWPCKSGICVKGDEKASEYPEEDGGLSDFVDEKVKKEPFSEPKLEKVPEEKVSKEPPPTEPPPKDGGSLDSGSDNQSEPLPEVPPEPQVEKIQEKVPEPTHETKPEPQPESVKETRPDLPNNKRQCTKQSDCNGLFCDSCYCVPKGTFSDSCQKDTDCKLGGKCVGGICSLCHFSP